MSIHPQSLPYAQPDTGKPTPDENHANGIAVIMTCLNAAAAAILLLFIIPCLPRLFGPRRDADIGVAAIATLAAVAEIPLAGLTFLTTFTGTRPSRGHLWCLLIVCLINYGLAAAFVTAAYLR